MTTDKQPRFVVIEGLDGAGTTTQARLVAEALRARDLRVHLTAEPSDGPCGTLVRAHVHQEVTLDPIAAALTFCADRADHLAREIRPALARGEWVVCDRYVLSTLAYQGAEGVDREWVMGICESFDVPDLTVFLDLPHGLRAERMAGRDRVDRYEAPGLAEPLRDSYLESIALLGSRGHRIEVLDASGSADAVSASILKRLDNLRERSGTLGSRTTSHPDQGERT